MLPTRRSEPSESIPPASADASPAVFLDSTVFPEILERVTVVVDPWVR
jgi:hypothetical protein